MSSHKNIAALFIAFSLFGLIGCPAVRASDEESPGLSFISDRDLNQIDLVLKGLIQGGEGSTAYDPIFGDIYGGQGIDGIYLESSRDIDRVTLINDGLIEGGIPAIINVNPNLFYSTYERGGNGISFFAVGDIDNVRVTNYGEILGGPGGNAFQTGFGTVGGSFGGDGITLQAGNSINHVKLINYGRIQGGNGGAGISPFVEFNGFFSFINPTIAGGGNGGRGISIFPGYGGSHISVTNYGTIIGGNAGDGGYAGIGVDLYALVSRAKTNLTINNWGAIDSGAGLDETAIYIRGSKNVINLDGHSSIFGVIDASGKDNDLNIAFSGISPSEKRDLKKELTEEHIAPGHTSAGSIIVRGETIRWNRLNVRIKTTSYEEQGIESHEEALGADLDSFSVNPKGDMLTVLNAVDQSGGVPQALSQLSPLRYEIYSDIAFSNANFTVQEIDARLNNLREGSENVDLSGLDSDPSKEFGLSKDGKSVEAPEPSAPAKTWGMFASAAANFGDIGAHGGLEQESQYTTAGLLAGLDAKISDQLTGGLLFGYLHTGAEFDTEGSTAGIDSYSGGLYAGYHEGNFFANGLVTYGRNNYASQRNILIQNLSRAATASTGGDQYVADIDGGYDVHLNEKLTVSPIAGFQYVHLDLGGFDENGADAANLAVGGQHADSFRSRFGTRLDYHIPFRKNLAFASELRLAWQHEFLDDSRGINAQFENAGLASFTVRTTHPERDAALLGVGVNATFKDNLTLYVDYDVQAGQAHYLEQNIKGGVRWDF